MRRICVVTGSRAEYGHMRWLVRDLMDSDSAEVTVVAAGTHLSPYHGNTVAEIEAAGCHVERIDSLLAGDGSVAAAKSMALALMGFAETLGRLGPDLVVVLGDRYEMLAAASAAMLLHIPIAHLHGGEATEGQIDEAIRHSITKMAHLHFVAAEPYRQRVIQLGENPARVFNFGAPGLDYLTRGTLFGREELESSLGVELRAPILLVTYHPQSFDSQSQADAAATLIEALGAFPDATVIFTGVNADPGNAAVVQIIQGYASTRPERVRLFNSLGSLRYLSLMAQAHAVVGNSSSGIIEAPALKVPTVNIGDRQKGRLRAVSVSDCPSDAVAIVEAIRWVVSAEGQGVAKGAQAPYGNGDASRRIAAVLTGIDLDGILTKTFHSLGESWT